MLQLANMNNRNTFSISWTADSRTRSKDLEFLAQKLRVLLESPDSAKELCSVPKKSSRRRYPTTQDLYHFIAMADEMALCVLEFSNAQGKNICLEWSQMCYPQVDAIEQIAHHLRDVLARPFLAVKHRPPKKLALEENFAQQQYFPTPNEMHHLLLYGAHLPNTVRIYLVPKGDLPLYGESSHLFYQCCTNNSSLLWLGQHLKNMVPPPSWTSRLEVARADT